MPLEQSAALRQAIKAQAKRLGFDLAGVTTPDPPPHFETFTRWLSAGRHGAMTYLASERSVQRRADPRQILPECRSILVLGVCYPSSGYLPPESPPGYRLPFRESGEQGSILGRAACYAWGSDYHEALAPRLAALVDFIQAQVGAPLPNRWFTDTGPLLERDLAQRAGLGWIGKNTCLINSQLGSFFLLAEILLGLELLPDPPFNFDRCGSCTRCLEACPTGCILPDRTIDAQRCISYLTIELKGAIPPALRSQIGEWVFGCDICQQVCPWNQRFAVQSNALQGASVLLAHPDVAQPNLLQELTLSTEQFNRKFKDSPVKRAKRRGYLRNVAVALGNRASPLAIPTLESALLSDPEPLVRSHVAWALGQVGKQAALQALEQAALSEKDTDVLHEIQASQTHAKLGNA